jgi:hypothetical protein
MGDDATLWDAYVSAGVPKDSATALVHQRAQIDALSPADAWDRLVGSGMARDAATAMLKSRANATDASDPELNAPTAFMHHMADAGTFGFGPKVVAAISSLKDNHDLSGYDSNLSAIREKLNRQHELHPVASVSGDLVGAIGSPLNKILPGAGLARDASVVAKVAGGAKAGAAAGAAYGVGHNDGSFIDHVMAGLRGGTTGAIGGGVVGGVAGGASTLLAKRTGDIAGPLLLPAMARAETSPEALAANPPSMLADVLPDLARTARSYSSKARQTIDNAIAARRAQQLPTISSALETGLGAPRGSVRQSVSDIISKRAEEAQPMYDKAYASPDISDPIVNETMKLPAFRKAYAVASRIAETEGKPLPPLPSGEIPIPESLAGNADATAAFTKAYTSQHGAMPGIPIRAIDLVKRGLNDTIDSGLRSGNMGRAEARALQSRLSTMLSRVDELAPDYAAARGNFAGHSSLVDAAEAGQEFLSPKVGAADIAQHLDGLSASEKELYRRGAMDALLTRIEAARGSATGKADLVSKFYASVGGRAKVRALFPSDESYQAFHTAMDKLADQNQTAAFVTGGSQTADKAAQQTGFSNSASSTLHFLRHPGLAVVSALAHSVLGRAVHAGNVRAADAVASHLVSSGPELDALLRTLQGAPKSAIRHLVDRAERAIVSRGGVGSVAALHGLLSPE